MERKKNSLKRIAAAFLAVTMLGCCMTGCGSSDKNTADTDTSSKQSVDTDTSSKQSVDTGTSTEQSVGTDTPTEKSAPQYGNALVSIGNQNEDYTYDKYEDHIVITKYDGSDTEVTIPNTIDNLPVTEIGKKEGYAFKDCDNITNIMIPDSVIGIGYYAFYGCTSLTFLTA